MTNRGGGEKAEERVLSKAEIESILEQAQILKQLDGSPFVPRDTVLAQLETAVTTSVNHSLLLELIGSGLVK